MSALIGWVGGDSYKVAYFFIHDSPIQFKVCAIFQLSVDMMIVVQRIFYGNAPPDSTALPMEDDLEEALVLSEER